MLVENFVGRPEDQDFVSRQAFRERTIDCALYGRFGHPGLTADPLVMMNFIRRPVPAPHPDDGQFSEHGREGIPAAGRICHGEKAGRGFWRVHQHPKYIPIPAMRSEEHTSEPQSLMRISYAVFCLKKKTRNNYFKKR